MAYLFEVDRKLIRKHTSKRVSYVAPAYLAGVLEYVLLEILEVSGKLASGKEITPAIVKSAIKKDAEMNALFIKTCKAL